MKGEPNVSYICSRYYRAPELIFGATDYTVDIGMWNGTVVLEWDYSITMECSIGMRLCMSMVLILCCDYTVDNSLILVPEIDPCSCYSLKLMYLYYNMV